MWFDNVWHGALTVGRSSRRRFRASGAVLWLTLLLLLLLPALEAQAQGSGVTSSVPAVITTASVTNTTDAAVTASRQPAPVHGSTLRQAWHSGGWIMWLLAAMAGFGVLLMIRQLLFSSSQHVSPHGLLTALLERVRAGELGEARRLCEDRPCPLSVIALKAFDHLRYAPKAGVTLLRNSVDAECARQADLMKSQVQLMLDIAVIAPMFGLLGTALGLLQFFGPADADPGVVQTAMQTGGIVQALATTAFGLVVSIPAVVCHAWLRRRTTRQIAALESAAAEIVMSVVGRYDR